MPEPLSEASSSTNQRPGNWWHTDTQTDRQTFINTGPGLSSRALDKKSSLQNVKTLDTHEEGNLLFEHPIRSHGRHSWYLYRGKVTVDLKETLCKDLRLWMNWRRSILFVPLELTLGDFGYHLSYEHLSCEHWVVNIWIVNIELWTFELWPFELWTLELWTFEWWTFEWWTFEYLRFDLWIFELWA